MGACFAGSPLGASVSLGQMKSFSEEILDGGAGEVVDDGIKGTVEISQADGEKKCVGHVFQGRAELRQGQIGVFVGLDPDQHLHQVAW